MSSFVNAFSGNCFLLENINSVETISVADLSHKMSVKGAEVVKVLMGMGQMVTINQILDQETGISPGQACVFYNKDEYGFKVLGGGWIKN